MKYIIIYWSELDRKYYLWRKDRTRDEAEEECLALTKCGAESATFLPENEAVLRIFRYPQSYRDGDAFQTISTYNLNIYLGF